MGNATPLVFSAAALSAVASALLRAAGSSPQEAEVVAQHLVLANKQGHDSHGVAMLPLYLERVAGGRLIPNAKLEIIRDEPGFLAVDGGLATASELALRGSDFRRHKLMGRTEPNSIRLT